MFSAVKRATLLGAVTLIGVSGISGSALAAPPDEALKESAVDTVAPAFLAPGPITRYPSTGGVWKYGFWNARARSYYTVKRTHTSTVMVDRTVNKSIKTASGRTSIAHIYTWNHPWRKDAYWYNAY